MSLRNKLLVRFSITTSVLLFSAGLTVKIASSQALPAPLVDRVGFPADYKSTFIKLYTLDNFQNRQIRVVWGNTTAASVSPGKVFKFPHGSIILFESFTVMEDASGEPMLDADGRFIPNNLT